MFTLLMGGSALLVSTVIAIYHAGKRTGSRLGYHAGRRARFDRHGRKPQHRR